MDSRRWIIFIFAGLILLAISARVAWQVLSVEDRLRRFIISELQPYFEGELNIAKLSVKPNHITLQNVSLQLPKQSIQLDIKKTQLGFSPYNAFKYNFNPVRLISQVVLENPEFRIQGNFARGSSRESEGEGPRFDVDKIKETYESKLLDINFVGSISIKDGEVAWLDSLGEEITLVNKLNGWLRTSDLANSTIRMSGRLFGSGNENIVLTGHANLLASRLDSVVVTFFDDNLSTTIPTIFPEILKIEKGQLLGRGILQETSSGRLSLDGEVNLTDADLDLFGGIVRLDKFNTSAKISDWNVELTSCSLECYGSPFVIDGEVLNVLDPSFNLRVSATELDLDRIFSEIWGEEKSIGLSGLADAEISISDEPASPKFSGEIRVPDFAVSGKEFKALKTRFTYQFGKFSIAAAEARFQDFDLRSKGLISIDTEIPTVDMDFDVFGDFRNLLKKGLDPELHGFPLQISGRLSGDLDNYVIDSKFETMGITAENDSVPIQGTLEFDSGTLRLTAKNGDGPFTFQAQIRPENDHLQFNAKIDHFGGDLWELTSLPIKDRLQNLLDLSCDVTGDQNYATYQLTAHRKIFTRDNLLFKIDGFYSSSEEGSDIQGDITYQPDTGGTIPGFLKLQFSPEYVNLKEYKLGDFYSAQANIEFSGDRPVSGKLILNDADLTYIFDGVLLNPAFGVLGKVDGEVLLGGTLDAPVIESDATFSDVIIRGEGYYSGDVLMQLTGKTLDFREFKLFKEDIQLMEGKGSIDLANQLLDIDATGKDVNVSTILNLIIGEVDFVEGLADFDLSLSNKLATPEIGGRIHAKDGRLFFVLFDSLKLDVGKPQSLEDIASLGSFSPAYNGELAEIASDSAAPGMYFNGIRLLKNDQYLIEGSAFLPFSSEQDMDIHLAGSGDAMAVLFGNLPEVKESQSDATFRWGFGGSYGNVVYTEGEVNLKKGKVWLEEIVPVVENIEVEAKLDPENQFIDVTNMSGVIDGEKVFVETNLDSFRFDNGMEPLVITEWGLNFGAILVKTGRKGVPLNIPGTMSKGEEGWFTIKGYDPYEYFTVTGPEEHPVAKGEILVSRAAFMFPFEFEEGVSTEPSLTEKILERMVWDVRMVPTKDVRYVKQFPGIVDNIWVNAAIDPKISELKFTGIFEDESFRTEGLVQSTRGDIEYLDFNFGVEKFAAEFDRSDIYPIVYGRGRTTYTDSLGVPSNIYLTLYLYDPETKQELERGRWNEDVRFKLSSDNPLVGSNDVQVLATLGYSLSSVDQFRSKATDVIGLSTDHLVFRPLFRPVERTLERTLGMDAIRFRSRFARNFIDLNSDIYSKIDPRYLIFRSTQVTVGKYLSENLYLLYSGQLEAGLDPRYQEEGVGLKHTVDLEYRINPNLLLELQYNYDSLLILHKDDTRVQIRHSFVF
jgi:hypothetical protein